MKAHCNILQNSVLTFCQKFDNIRQLCYNYSMNKELIFVNDVPEQFIEHQEYVKEVLNDFFSELDFDCKLKIKFVDFANTNEYEYTDCMLRNISVKEHELTIVNSTLNTINLDGGRFFCLSIYHEFAHIKDYVNMMKTQLFKFNFCLAHHKNFERHYISSGFLFWTEIDAYYQTFEFAKEKNLHVEKITFGNLVANYIKTISLHKNLYYKKDLSYDEAIKYVNSVDSFVYLCSKYMASYYANHSRIPHSRICKNKDYKKVYSILQGIEPSVTRLINNTYNSKSYDNLFKLGKHICEKIRWKIFKVGLIKKHGSILSFY